MRKPRGLKPGDPIRLVSPASPISREKVGPFMDWMAREGYSVSLGRHAFDADFYLAGADGDRARDLQEAFADPDVPAVMCTRGGYGCARLMPFLDLDAMATSGTMFLGFSDVTTLHLALNRRGLVTFHAPMALTFTVDREPWVGQSFLRALRGEIGESGSPPGTCVTPGTAEGPVTGGCLCLLTDSIGTPDALDGAGKIVLIEDVDENPHRIDAMLTHLRLGGAIRNAAGIIVGEMTRTDEKIDEGIGGRPWREVVRDRLGDLGVPMIIDYPFGHAKNMLTLPLGIRARLDANAGTLTYTESSCVS